MILLKVRGIDLVKHEESRKAGSIQTSFLLY
jgi:hypothetical protein